MNYAKLAGMENLQVTYVAQKSAADGVLERIRTQGGKAHALRVDTPKESEILQLFAEGDRLGRLSALVYNGGITGPKGGIDALTIGLAREVGGQGIRVNAVSPGPIRTDIHVPGKLERIEKGLPMQRAGEPEEVASAVMYLVSDAASYVAGANLAVAGAR